MSTVLSVIVPNYRRPDLLRTCISSLRAARVASGHDVELIVVDDGSADESCQVVRNEFPEVKLVALRRNHGYAGAVNAGIRASAGDWILTLNNDTTVAPDLFDELLAVAGCAPDIGLVAAQVRFSANPSMIYSAGLEVDRRGHASDRLMGQPVSASEAKPVELFGACGCAALYLRSMLDQLGGLDERFQFGLEDADLAWRAHMLGWRCLYAPGAVVFHDLGATIPHGSELRLFQAGRNRVLLMAKNLDTRQLLRDLPAILVFDLAYVAYSVLRFRSLAPLKGRIAGLRRWRTVRALGAPGRRAVPLKPPAPLAQALRRRRAWPQPTQPEADTAAPRWSRA